MKKLLASLIALAILASMMVGCTTDKGPRVFTGALELQGPGEASIAFTLSADGKTVTGAQIVFVGATIQSDGVKYEGYQSTIPLSEALVDKTGAFTATKEEMELKGTINGSNAEGTFHLLSSDGDFGVYPWTAKSAN
jgi:hypothetical protein